MSELQLLVDRADYTRPEAEPDLVERTKHDRASFALLYRRHYAAIAGYIHRRVGDAHETEDLVSDVFLAAMRGLSKYQYRGVPFRAWLYRLATNTVNRWARRRRRWALRSLDGDGMPHDVASKESADGDLDLERVRLALLSLPPKFQTVLALHYLEGLKVEAVAEVVGCRVGTVKSRLSRARNALRERLKRWR